MLYIFLKIRIPREARREAPNREVYNLVARVLHTSMPIFKTRNGESGNGNGNGNGEWGMGNGERGTGNGESLK